MTAHDTAPEAAVVIEDVHKAYGEVRAVDGVSLTVGQGEFFGILGPNGAGKTTLIEMVEGLREADSGRSACWAPRPGRATSDCCGGSGCRPRRRRSSPG